SIEFIIFFFIVTMIYFLIPHKLRWILLLVSSCIFYMAWQPAYIILVLICALINYFSALMIEKHNNQGTRKFWLVLSLSVSLGILFIYKYFGFINETLNNIFTFLNFNYPVGHFDILLPMGISFYTFHVYVNLKVGHHFN